VKPIEHDERPSPGSGTAGKGAAPGGGAAFLAAVVPALAAWAVLAWRFDWLNDDAFISFRYARNLARGLGLCFNPGVHPPVEGYSNFLWNVYLALFELLHLDVTLFSRLTTALAAAVLLVYTAAAARRALGLDCFQTLWTALFFGTLPTVVVWSTGGLETAVAGLLLFTVYERLLGDPDRPRPYGAGIAAVLFVLLREEAAAFMAVLLATAFLTGRFTRRRGLARAAGITSLFTAAAVLLFLAWRYAYYGDFLSNTARLKAGFHLFRVERGALYAASYFLTVPSCLLVLLLPLLPRFRPKGLLALHAYLLIGADLAFAVLTGGDFMPMGRFLVYAMPFLALLFAGVVKGAAGGKGRRRFLPAAAAAVPLVVLSLLPLFDVHPVPEGIRRKFSFRWHDPSITDFSRLTEYGMWEAMKKANNRFVRLAKALKRWTRPGESIILGAVGAVGYYTDLHIYDVYGLVNREVALRDAPPRPTLAAHDRAVPYAFFLGKEPTYLAALILREKDLDRCLPQVKNLFPGLPPERMKVESHPLDPREFGKGKKVLVLVRYLPDRAPPEGPR